tara:strand:+ start:578 stop:964 length:387 start_codon:yes stop_codon:yes gene_type:complete
MGKKKNKTLNIVSAQPEIKYNKSLRKSMFRSVGEVCQCCGEKRTKQNGLVLTVHHILPVRAGGLATRENGLVACADCHTAVHDYIDPLGDVGRNFWQDMADYILSLPKATEECRARFSSGEEYIKKAA